jgi:hypothetical protein
MPRLLLLGSRVLSLRHCMLGLKGLTTSISQTEGGVRTKRQAS